MNARAKGERLGIFSKDAGKTTSSQGQAQGEQLVEVLGRQDPCVITDDGLRGILNGRIVQARSVLRNLQNAFANSQGLMADSGNCT